MFKPILASLFLASILGSATCAPSGVERALYTVQTNYVTNVVQVVQVNEEKVVTNSFPVTNIFAQYHLEPKQSALDTITTASSVATTAGLGWAGLAGTFIASLLYGWAEFRNRKKDKVTGVLTNNVEVGYETILATAGAAVADRFIDAIKSSQVKAGVKADVAAVVDSQVDTAEARNEAASVVSLAKRNPAPTT